MILCTVTQLATAGVGANARLTLEVQSSGTLSALDTLALYLDTASYQLNNISESSDRVGSWLRGGELAGGQAYRVRLAVAPETAPDVGSETIDDQAWVVGEAVSLAFPKATGGNGTRNYGISPALPAGLSWTGNFVLGGTLTTSQGLTGYTYTVTDSDAVDPDSASLTFDISVAPAKAPALTATAGNGQVSLSCDEQKDFGIQSWEYQQDGGAWTRVAPLYGDPSTDPRTLSTTVTGLSNDVAYTFHIRAVAGSGDTKVAGAASDAVEATPVEEGTPGQRKLDCHHAG